MDTQNTVLVVEDNDFVRMQIVSHLKGVGCNVLEASDGGAALQEVGKSPLDLAIVDVRMEPMGGFDFLKTIRQEGFELPVILVTGDDATDMLEKAGQFGVAAVLRKPVEKERLLTMVGRVINLGVDGEDDEVEDGGAVLDEV